MARLLRLASIGMVAVATLALSTTVWAQPGGGGGRGAGRGFGGFGGGGGPYTLLNSESVQKELNVVDDQKTKIKEIMDKAQAAARESFQGLRDLSQEERTKRMADLREKMQTQRKETEKAIEAVLLEPQIKRLKELYVQVRGAQALRDPDVQSTLGLSDAQKAMLADPLKILTPDQQAAFEKLKGEKFDTSSIRAGGPGGPGGRQRGNRGGGQRQGN